MSDRTEKSREAWMRYARESAARLAHYDSVIESAVSWRASPRPPEPPADAVANPRLSFEARDEARKDAIANGKHIVDGSIVRQLAGIFDARR